MEKTLKEQFTERLQYSYGRYFPELNEQEDPAMQMPPSPVPQAGGAEPNMPGGADTTVPGLDSNEPSSGADAEQEEPEEGKSADADLKKEIEDKLKKYGGIPVDFIVDFYKGKKEESEVKAAIDDLVDNGKVVKHERLELAVEDGPDIGIEDEEDLEPETEEEPPAAEAGVAAAPPPPPAGGEMGAPPPATPTGPAGGGMPPAMMPNYMMDDEEGGDFEDEDFDALADKDDEFDDGDDIDDEIEDDEEMMSFSGEEPEMDDDEEEEDDGELADVIDDVDDIKVLLRSIEPKLRKLRDKTSSAKKARNAVMNTYSSDNNGYGHGPISRSRRAGKPGGTMYPY